MEEDEFRATYHQVNQRRCRFEKAINAQRVGCHQAETFLLAGREGIACGSAPAQRRCEQLLQRLREAARFSLMRTRVDGPLPHNAELRVQAGGLQGIAALLVDAGGPGVTDVCALLDRARERFGALEQWPYSDIVRHMARFRGRRRHRT